MPLENVHRIAQFNQCQRTSSWLSLYYTLWYRLLKSTLMSSKNLALRAAFHTYLFSCQHVLINTQYHYPHLRLRHTKKFFSHGRSTLCCFCCFSMTKSTHCSTCVDTWYFSINIQYHSTYLLILAPIFHIQINTIKIWWHVVIDN